MMQMDWSDNLWRLPLTLLILIHRSEMEEKINWSKEQLLWLSHFHEWNQSAMWFNCIVSIIFHFKIYLYFTAYVKYSLDRLILDPQILSLPNQNASCSLCADARIKRDPLCCGFAWENDSKEPTFQWMETRAVFELSAQPWPCGVEHGLFRFWTEVCALPCALCCCIEIPSNTQLKQALSVYSPSLPLLWLQCKCSTDDLADGRGKWCVRGKHRTGIWASSQQLSSHCVPLMKRIDLWLLQ